jgi:hypothetical protein
MCSTLDPIPTARVTRNHTGGVTHGPKPTGASNHDDHDYAPSPFSDATRMTDTGYDPTLRAAGRIHVLIADDHGVVQTGLHVLLDLDSALEGGGEAADGLQAVRLAHRMRPEVVVMRAVCAQTVVV